MVYTDEKVKCYLCGTPAATPPAKPAGQARAGNASGIPSSLLPPPPPRVSPNSQGATLIHLKYALLFVFALFAGGMLGLGLGGIILTVFLIAFFYVPLASADRNDKDGKQPSTLESMFHTVGAMVVSFIVVSACICACLFVICTFVMTAGSIR